MLIRQRSTFADDFLLRVVFPYLEEHNVLCLLRLARLWNREVRSAASFEAAARLPDVDSDPQDEESLVATADLAVR